MKKMRRIFWALGAPDMRRILAAVVVAALGVAALAGGRPVSDARAATTCTKHAKRVFKHVKRHGKPMRVVHLAHYWTCQEVADPAPTTAAAPSPPSAPAPPPTPAPTPEPEPNAVSVTANDRTDPYEYVPSRTTVKAGRLTVQLNNAGEDEHNMDMQRLGEGGVPEGPVVVAVSAERENHSEPTAVEVQPGTYRMWCTIGHHAEHGMETTITVE
jgi:plastocyanin